MVYEFAVDPAALSTWDKFRIVINSCGVEHGRLISRFPKNWKEKVLNACTDQPVKKKSIATRLFRLSNSDDHYGIDHLLVRFGRPYNNTESWFANAEMQHAEMPFKAIVTNTQNANESHIIYIDDVDDLNAAWQTTPPTPFIVRTPENLAKCARLLLMASKHIFFIDPHFDPTQRRYREPFKKYLEFAFKQKPPERIEIHTQYKEQSKSWWISSLEEFFDLLPNKSAITVYRWENWNDNMHSRHIITDFGGVQYDYGLGADPQSTTEITLRSYAYSRQILKQFSQNSSPFKLHDINCIENS